MSNVPNSHESVQTAALALVKADSDAATLQAVATVLKYSIEAEKAQIETKNLSRGAATEAFRFYVPVIAPLISAVAVVGALVFQTAQFRETSRLQAQAVEIQKQTVQLQANAGEDTAWREALKALTQSPTVMSGVTGTTLLTTYMSSGTHVEEARSIALSLLGGLQFVDIFKPLFAKAMQVTPADKRLTVLADVSFRLRESYQTLSAVAREMHPTPPIDLPSLTDAKGMGFPNPLFARNQVNRQLTLVCETLGNTLKTVNVMPLPSETLGITLWDCDMASIDFKTLALVGADIQNVALNDADLGKISTYDRSSWSNTAWWHARRIEASLLQYLAGNYPFSKKTTYTTSETQQDYDANLIRLRAAK